MRNDVEWQDVPGPENRASFTWNNGTELNGPLTDRFMTPLDVAFSYCYGALGWGFTIAYTYSGTISLDHVAISPIYEAAWEGTLGHNSTVDGATWCNETYVNSVFGAPASALLWPIHQLTTLGETPYYTTDQYLTNFVQFNPALGPNQIQIYLSENWPWLGIYTALGMSIIPFDIFSNLALGAWYITAPGFNHGNTWTTPDETLMDLEPYSYNSGTGADLLYGSGPFVLVDDAAAVAATTFRLDAYKPGLTYGPGLTGAYGHDTITTDHGYFWSSPVRESDQMAFTMAPQGVAVPGHSPAPNYYYKVDTHTLYMEYYLTNYDTANTYTVTFTPTIIPWWYESGAWVEGADVAGATITVTLAAGASVGIWVSIPLTVPSNALWLCIEKDFTLTITVGPTGTVGRIDKGQGFVANQWAGYTEGTAMINLADLAGDLAGGASTSGYYGANGVINLSDLGIVTGNWQAHVNWATVDPTSAPAKADINGNGVINLSDLGFVTGNWQHHWAITTLPPTSLPQIS
jgi:hypothetical protein